MEQKNKVVVNLCSLVLKNECLRSKIHSGSEITFYWSVRTDQRNVWFPPTIVIIQSTSLECWYRHRSSICLLTYLNCTSHECRKSASSWGLLLPPQLSEPQQLSLKKLNLLSIVLWKYNWILYFFSHYYFWNYVTMLQVYKTMPVNCTWQDLGGLGWHWHPFLCESALF